MKRSSASLFAAVLSAAHAYYVPTLYPDSHHSFRHNFGYAIADVSVAGAHPSELETSQEGRGQDIHNALETMAAFISPFMPDPAAGSFEITHFYKTPHNGLTHVFTSQFIDTIPVMNGLGHINLDKNNNLVSSSDSFWKGEVPKVGIGTISKVEAIENFLNVIGEGAPPVSNVPDESAQQMWVIDGKDMKLSWVFEVTFGDFEHVLEVAVDAETGLIIQCYDLVIGDEDLVAAAEVPGIRRKLADTTEHAKYRGWGVPNMAPNLGDSELHVDPHLKVPEASPLGWHAISSSQTFRDTRGNNVYAQENSKNEDGFPPENGYRPESKSEGIDFDFEMDFNNDPADGENLDATITNLFLMSNIMHDLLYTYGFDEQSGNFQINNFENGGEGQDPVVANSLDGSGDNNANMYTPSDGYAPRMRMYRWNYLPGEDRASSLDGSVVAHEYVHGLSSRLTGGPQNPGCLSTLDAGGMGEGWSDYIGIMMSIDEANGFERSHGIGNWLVGGIGIRRYPYTTDMSINPFTFDDVNDARTIGVHEIGTIWASMLFDMSADLVFDVGFNEDIYQCTNCSAENQGGNNIALQLVIDAMKIQPCNPSFIEARDAILMADEINYDGAHHCSIWRSFARRGLGIFASDNRVASESFCAPDECQSAGSPACTSAPTPAPFSDVDLGLLEIGEIFVEGSTQGRSDTYGNPAPDVRVLFTIPTLEESSQSNIEISLCSTLTQYDTYIWLLDSRGNVVASNDDDSCYLSTLFSYLNLSVGLDSSSLTAGEEYVLVVDGYASYSGNFGLSISLETGASSMPTPSPSFPPSLPSTAVPTFLEDGDDDSDDVCNALRILTDELGFENLCGNILELDIDYQCGVGATANPTPIPTAMPTAFPTEYPTAMPTAHPTEYPTAKPTAFPTAISRDEVTISVKIKIANNPRFTTEEAMYVILLGENGQSEPLNVGMVTAGTTHFVEFEGWQYNIEDLYAVRICVDENEPKFTKFFRSKFLLSIDELEYTLKNKGGKAKVSPSNCREEDVVLA